MLASFVPQMRGLVLSSALVLVSWIGYKFLLFRRSVQVSPLPSPQHRGGRLTLLLSQRIDNHPGFRSFLSDMNIIAYLIPSGIPYVNDHIGWQWRRKRTYNRTTYSVSSPRACKILNADRRRFQKPVKLYEILKVFGSNVVVTEGEEWRRHRKRHSVAHLLTPSSATQVVAPGFSEKVFELVWDTATWTTLDLFAREGWDSLAPGEGKEVKDIPEITLRVTLAVLVADRTASSVATASFGAPLGPQKDNETTAHGMSFVEAISYVSENIFWLLALPKIVYKLPIAKLQRIQRADRALRAYMHGMIASRRDEIRRGEESVKHDLFHALVKASIQDKLEEEDGTAGGSGGGGLSDDELVGNTWIFALAGHETSAHSLAFAIAYLAIHQDKQAWLYEELLEVFPADHVPTYQDYSRLPRTLAVIYETLRLHPAVVYIPKYATEDTWLPDEPDDEELVDGQGEAKRVFVPKGTQCGIDTVGLHRHREYLFWIRFRRLKMLTSSGMGGKARYWKNPDSFLPERFLEDYDRDAFAPFSAGARACIGRKFSEVENVCVLALILRHFRVLPLTTAEGAQSPIDTADDTIINEMLAEKLLATKPGVTLTPKEIGVRLVRREDGTVRGQV
ncbi:hypothetical protein QFC19_000062 [Naganishia cerealis]|uniref:Uncharacterized protein n=1 Tax=Naganishia cerealis TaxID=610337 RepID=A0ACC2WRQ1_9TREE|nr:hypothetical protein QFC19_000062 [Naganishia cerealis]